MLPDHDASAELDADATRRSFLKKVAIGGAVAAIGTQVLPFNALVPGAAGQETEDGEDGAGGDDATTDTTEADAGADATVTPDEELMAYLAGLAHAAAEAYRATAGEVEDVGGDDDEEEEEAPAETTTTLPRLRVPQLAEPVIEIIRVFGSHHAQQAAALSATAPAIEVVPNGTLLTEVRAALTAASDEGAVLTTLRQMEERLAATHLAAIGSLQDTADASLVAAALPIVSQHAVVLGRIGATPAPIEELVPELQTTDDELPERQYPAEATAAPAAPDTDPDANAGGDGADSGAGGSTDETPGDGTDSSAGGADDGSGETPSDTDSEN